MDKTRLKRSGEKLIFHAEATEGCGQEGLAEGLVSKKAFYSIWGLKYRFIIKF